MRSITRRTRKQAAEYEFTDHGSLGSGPAVLVISACEWNDCGGAQRPVALAREYALEGYQVFYWGADSRSRVEEPGVLVLTAASMRGLVAEFCKMQGICVCHIASRAQVALLLKGAGWAICYDLMDDWQGFVDAGDGVTAKHLELEPALCANADFVSYSAPSLYSYARTRGAQRTVYVPNGGPPAQVPFSVREERNGRTRWAYCGTLWGSWINWDVIDELSKNADLRGTVIGRLPDSEGVGRDRKQLAQYRTPGVTFWGQRPHSKALGIMARCDVGTVPFQGALCAAVDPVKLYDHYAAGLWTVTTPDVVPLIGRPYVLVADRADWPDAVREAAELRKTDPPTQEVVEENSWARRASVIMEAVYATLERAAS